jgi:hypothetical protein
MRNQEVNIKTAKLASKKGYNNNNYGWFYYSKEWKSIFWTNKKSNESIEYFKRPTQSLLQKWLRDKHKCDITVITNWINGVRVYYVGLSYINESNQIDIWFARDVKENTKIEFKTYEAALEKGLYQALTLIKE